MSKPEFSHVRSPDTSSSVSSEIQSPLLRKRPPPQLPPPHPAPPPPTTTNPTMKGKASSSPNPSKGKKKLGLSFRAAARKVVLAEKVFGTINKGSDRDNHVRVCVRMRQLNSKEKNEQDTVAWKVKGDSLEEYDSDGIKNAQTFSFDHVGLESERSEK